MFNFKLMMSNLQNQNKIGLGMAYRFNNFKNKQIIKQAQNYDTLEKMLKHVKAVIKRRNQIFQTDTTTADPVLKTAQQRIQLEIMEEDNHILTMEEDNQIPIIEQFIED
jgi:hypothetical protein